MTGHLDEEIEQRESDDSSESEESNNTFLPGEEPSQTATSATTDTITTIRDQPVTTMVENTTTSSQPNTTTVTSEKTTVPDTRRVHFGSLRVCTIPTPPPPNEQALSETLID